MTQDARLNSRCKFAARALATSGWIWLAVAIPYLTDVSCDLGIGTILAGIWVALAIPGLICFPLLFGFAADRQIWWWVRRCANLPAALLLGLVLARTDVGLIVRVQTL